MKLTDRLKRFIRPSPGTLRRTLAIYFIPISVIPVVVISFYATHVIQKSTNEILIERAYSERDAIMGEIEAMENDRAAVSRLRVKQGPFTRAVQTKKRDTIEYALSTFPLKGRRRVYSSRGKLLAAYGASTLQDVDYISKQGLREVRRNGESIQRYFSPKGMGFVTIIRHLIRTKRNGILGVYEEEHSFGQAQLLSIKDRRKVDVILFDEKFTNVSASLALPKESLQSVTSLDPTTSDTKIPNLIQLGDERYASFVYPIADRPARKKHFGYLALLLSMTQLDAAVGGLKHAMVYVALFLVLIASLLIFVFSNQIVRPIEALVAAMKRLKVGRVDQIPDLDSTYEIEYLVRSFNDMARNISEAKTVLEQKLQELHRANNEIKNAQSTLIQNAKMASLGQIVAGVAHELNNPIGFIYSNMHHLSEYADQLQKMLEGYREIEKDLPEEKRASMEKLLKELDVEFILKDVRELAKSCLDGAKRTKDIVVGLRTFSRIDESTFLPTDIHESIRSTLRLLTSEFKDRIQVHEDFGELPDVECNPSQMNQVFMNLLSNAGQAIAGRGEIWIHTTVDGDEVIIEIEDTGIGMPPETAEKIFDPFFTTKTVGEGTGLGLSIAYGLVQKHSGTITVDSRVGVGTRFSISLPIKQPVSIAAS